jgi:hypothetical protein
MTLWNDVRIRYMWKIVIFLFIIITDVDGISVGVRWLDRHILQNQTAALALCRFRFVFLYVHVSVYCVIQLHTDSNAFVGILFKFYI